MPSPSLPKPAQKKPGRAGRRANPDERALRRREILDASAELFTQVGFERTSVQMIADKVGINVALLYYYFSSKNQILFEFLKVVLEGLISSTRSAVASASEDVMSRLSAFVESHVLYQSEVYASSSLYTVKSLVLNDDGQASEYRKILTDLERENLQDLLSIIDAGVASGRFRVLDRTVTAFGILGLSEHFNHWFREDGALSASDVARLCSGLALRMVGAGQYDDLNDPPDN